MKITLSAIHPAPGSGNRVPRMLRNLAETQSTVGKVVTFNS